MRRFCFHGAGFENMVYYNKDNIWAKQGGYAVCTESKLKVVLQAVKNASAQLYGDKLNKIILYGSYARGDNTEESDIDIMIILDCDIENVKKMRGQTAEMSSNISIEQEVFLSILLRDRKHFEDSLDVLPFYQNIVREGITVYG